MVDQHRYVAAFSVINVRLCNCNVTVVFVCQCVRLHCVGEISVLDVFA